MWTMCYKSASNFVDDTAPRSIMQVFSLSVVIKKIVPGFNQMLVAFAKMYENKSAHLVAIYFLFFIVIHFFMAFCNRTILWWLHRAMFGKSWCHKFTKSTKYFWWAKLYTLKLISFAQTVVLIFTGLSTKRARTRSNVFAQIRASLNTISGTVQSFNCISWFANSFLSM